MSDNSDTTLTQSETAEKPVEVKTPDFEYPKPTDPQSLHLFYEPQGTLRMTVADDYSFPSVKLYQASPLNAPGRYLSLVNGKGEEVILVDKLSDFTVDSRIVAEDEIRRRYLTAQVSEITGIKTEFGITYWNVNTDKGTRDFVVQNLSESCVWLSDSHILLIDVDGNRFEIADRGKLDGESQARLSSVL